MKWKKDWIDGTTFCSQSLELSDHEIDVMKKYLIPIREKLEKKKEKYQDIHDSGEASTRQENILQEVEDDLQIIISFINTI